MDNYVFGETMENVRKPRDIKLVTTYKKRNQLALEPNYHTTKLFPDNVMATEMKKTRVKMNQPIILACPYKTFANHLCMNFGMITLNRNIKTKKNYVTQILKIFRKTLLMMLKNDESDKDCSQ